MTTQESFVTRHIGPRGGDVQEMARAAGFSSLEALVDATIPASIRMDQALDLAPAMNEQQYLEHIGALAARNKPMKQYIGMGYYPTVVPSVILRNVLENPGWYTAYTPYQAEIAQGRLEALLNFQTMVTDLTGMEVANASLLDEATAAAEAMIMFFNLRTRTQTKAGVNRFFVSEKAWPQTIEVLRTRAALMDIELVVEDYNSFTWDETFFGGFIQYPDGEGAIRDYRAFVEAAHAVDARVAVASDLMALAMLEAPGSWGADAVLGNSQRFGVPMGYGGPHAAFFATRESYKRHIPGRIIGVTRDRHGNVGFRMALQTREQHIKREKATSNICTAQALLAVMASMYAVYHGAEGIRHRAETMHRLAAACADALLSAGLKVVHPHFFDTLLIAVNNADDVVSRCLDAGFNIRKLSDELVGISIGETAKLEELNDLITAISGRPISLATDGEMKLGRAPRAMDYLTHPVFNSYRSESEMMRYIKRLENRDLSLVHSMISLGSCTMKLNAATELMPITWPEFANVHPFAPADQTVGYQAMLDELEKDLSEITGFAGVSLQPNSGAQGEYTGLLVIRAYHASRGDQHRNICLIPSSAHGTNPASAVMAGMKVVVVQCDEQGNVDVDDLRHKAAEHSESLGALMVTYPSTHGVFESAIKEITAIVHEHGGQVYMDGANMNAQVGLTSPGLIGADVCHLNLHKTFAIPHGGGGPGMGPIGVAQHLVPFLPGHRATDRFTDETAGAVSAAPFGSALILLISYAYIKLLGSDGLRESTEIAILNANYMRARLEGHYPILYKGESGNVAHEMIIDCREFKAFGIEVADIAKRLMDYGFHAPTVSFPVAGTMMIEPTESESKEEIDRFCDALISIREEVRNVGMGLVDAADNVLKNAPHTQGEVCADVWEHVYSRQAAAFPLDYVSDSKFWPAVARVDDAYGDRNLMCTCPMPEAYEPVT